MDIGIYLLSVTHSVFQYQKPTSIKATAVFREDIDWHTTVMLGYEKAQAVLDFGFDSRMLSY